jgi:hypothetical protein
MIAMIIFGAIGWTILYLLFGGGLGGAILIFIVAKMLAAETFFNSCLEDGV